MDTEFCIHADGHIYQNARERWDISDQAIESAYDELIIEQFTGLKDKNEKEIYEGDILKLGETCSFVVWSLGGWRFNSYMERGPLDLYRYVNTTTGGEIAEIIGNIHENRELL